MKGWLLAAVIIGALAASVKAQDAAGELSQLVGYTIMGSETVRESGMDPSGGTLIRFMSGATMHVPLLLLPPLPASTVVLLGRVPAPDVLQKYQGKVAPRVLYAMRVFIRDRAYLFE